MFAVETLLFIAEMIGVASGAVSGVLTAAKVRMDIFGAMTLGCVTAVGGGIIRDILLGLTPPAAFRNPYYIPVAAAVSLITFSIEYCFSDRIILHKRELEFWFNIFDALGLAVFVCVGVDVAFRAGFADNAFLTVFVGTITGVGGGMLRDTMAGQPPVVLQKRIYCIAAILGAVVSTYGHRFQIPDWIGSVAGAALILLIRFLATHYRWNLPRYPKYPETKS